MVNQKGKFPGKGVKLNGKKKPKRRRRGSQICYKCRLSGHFIAMCPELQGRVYKVKAAKVYQVEEILDYGRDPTTNDHMYLVKWIDHPEPSWESVVHLTGAISIIIDFEQSRVAQSVDAVRNQLHFLNAALGDGLDIFPAVA